MATHMRFVTNTKHEQRTRKNHRIQLKPAVGRIEDKQGNVINSDNAERRETDTI